MRTSHLTQKHQVTIPQDILKILKLHEGDLLGFEVHNRQVVIRKVIPLDLEFAQALEETLTEWTSKEDDKLYANL
jgi:antitoxin PrlF